MGWWGWTDVVESISAWAHQSFPPQNHTRPTQKLMREALTAISGKGEAQHEGEQEALGPLLPVEHHALQVRRGRCFPPWKKTSKAPMDGTGKAICLDGHPIILPTYLP